MDTRPTRAAYFSDAAAPSHGHLWQVFDEQRRKRIEASASLVADVIGSKNLAERTEGLADLEAVFATWGMPVLSAGQLDLLPSLKAVFYAAGSVRHFAGPLLERGIIVVSGADANAVPVAEYTLAAVLFSLKRGWSQALALRQGKGPGAWSRQPMTGAYGSVIGLIGLSMVGRKVCRLLRNFDLKVIAYDPVIDPRETDELDVELCPLEEVFARGDVVSLHAPLLPGTRGMITGAMIESMKAGSTFINTARGAIVAEEEMVAVLRRRPDLWAVLDVTDPEPPPAGSGLYELPNVILTPHIAGSMGGEVKRMADLVIAEFEAWRAGRLLRHAVSLKDLPTMA
jgi:phosphoglycerate dehydrogenase-like enzyme